MKAKPTKRRPRVAKAPHIVQEQETLIWQQMRNIQSQLRMHHSNLAGLYAFGCGEKSVQKSRCTKRAQDFQRTQEDELRLEWTVTNIQRQIETLQQELFQLLRSL